jgi:hypothetical protein
MTTAGLRCAASGPAVTGLRAGDKRPSGFMATTSSSTARSRWAGGEKKGARTSWLSAIAVGAPRGAGQPTVDQAEIPLLDGSRSRPERSGRAATKTFRDTSAERRAVYWLMNTRRCGTQGNSLFAYHLWVSLQRMFRDDGGTRNRCWPNFWMVPVPHVPAYRAQL